MFGFWMKISDHYIGEPGEIFQHIRVEVEQRNRPPQLNKPLPTLFVVEAAPVGTRVTTLQDPYAENISSITDPEFVFDPDGDEVFVDIGTCNKDTSCDAFRVFRNGTVLVQDNTFLDFDNEGEVPRVLPVVYTDDISGSVSASLEIYVLALRPAPEIVSREFEFDERAHGFVGRLSATDKYGDQFVYTLLESINNRGLNESRVNVTEDGNIFVPPGSEFLYQKCEENCTNCGPFDTEVILTLQAEVVNNDDGLPGPTVSEPHAVTITIINHFEAPRFIEPTGPLTFLELDKDLSLDISPFFCDVDGHRLLFDLVTVLPVNDFWLDSRSGILNVDAVGGLNYEEQHVYTAEIKTMDVIVPDLFISRNLTIYVVDVPEAPIIETKELFLDELTTFEDGPFGKISARDPDVLAGTSKPFSSRPSEFEFHLLSHKDLFVLDNSSGNISVAENYVPDFESLYPDTVFKVEIDVWDIINNVSTRTTILINILDVDEPPFFDPPVQNFTIDIVKQKEVIGTVTADDPDLDDTLSFRLVDGPNFTRIDRDSGKLKAITRQRGSKTVIDFDLEVGQKFKITVEVRDSTNLTAVGQHHIIVREEQISPEWEGKYDGIFSDKGVFQQDIDEHHDGPFDDVTLQCSDPNGGDVHFSLIGAYPPIYGNIFSVDRVTGVLKVINPDKLDFETIVQTYGVLTIACIDETGLDILGRINMTVNDIPENPEWVEVPEISELELAEDTPVGTILREIEVFDQDFDSAFSLSVSIRNAMNLTEHGSRLPLNVTALRYLGDGRRARANLTLTKALDYNVQNYFIFELIVVDQTGLNDTEVSDLRVLFVNTPPRFERSVFSVSVLENATSNDILSGGFDFTDRTPFDEDFSYTFHVIWSDIPDGFVFEGPNLKLSEGQSLDFDTRPTHELVIEITDPENLSDRANVSIELIDVNDIVISNFISPIQPTIGSGHIQFIGDNFGPIWREVNVSADLGPEDGSFLLYSSCRRELDSTSGTWNNTWVECQVPSGAGRNLVWTLHVDDFRRVASNFRMQYKAPVIQNITDWPIDAPTEGGQWFQVDGHSFGPPVLSKSTEFIETRVYVTYTNDEGQTFEAVNCSVVTQRIVGCLTAEGVGRNFVFSLTIGSSNWAQAFQSFSPLLNLSYASPIISDVQLLVSTVPTTGVSEGVAILGNNFGAPGTEMLGKMLNKNFTLQTECPSYQHNHTFALCNIPEGSATNYRWKVGVANVWSEVSSSGDVISYQPPTLSKVVSLAGNRLTDLDTEGKDIAILKGENFGPDWPFDLPIVVTYGASLEFGAINCKFDKPHVRLRCETVPGVGKDHSWEISVGSQASNRLDNVSNYHPPMIGTFRRSFFAPINADIDSFLTIGGETIIVGGRYFGPPGTVPDMAKYGNGTETFDVDDCEALDDQNLECLTAPGAGIHLSWTVVIAGQKATTTTTGYAAPEVFGFEGVDGSDPLRLSTFGGEKIDILGENFGPSEQEGSLLDKVTYGPYGDESHASNCSVLSHFRIRCTTVSGFGTGHRWIVTVASQSSSTSKNFTAYAAPSIALLSPNHGPTGFDSPKQEMPTIDLFGFDLGLQFIDGTAGPPLKVLMDPAGEASRVQERENISDWNSLITQYLEIQQLFPKNATEKAEDEGLPVDIIDDWFSHLTSRAVQKGNLHLKPNLTTDGMHHIQFRLPEGFGAMRYVMVELGGRISFPEFFSYDPPRIENVAPGVMANGEFKVVVDGFDFCGGKSCGNTSCCGRVYVNDELMEIDQDKYQHKRINLTIQDDGSPFYLLQIEVLDQPSPSDIANFSDVAPTLSRQLDFADFPEYNTTGGEILTLFDINGVYPGMDQDDIHITVRERECSVHSISSTQGEDGIWRSNITCLTPPNVGKDLEVRISVKGVRSPSQEFFVSYRSPTVCEAQLLAQGRHIVVYRNSERLCFSAGLFNYNTDLEVRGAMPTEGGIMTLLGVNFGSDELDPDTELFFVENDVHMEILSVQQDRIDASMPEGAGHDLEVLLSTSSEGTSETHFTVSFAPPSIERFDPIAIPTLPEDDFQLIIRGRNFGPLVTTDTSPHAFDVDVTATVNNEECPVSFSNHTVIVCRPPEGQGDKIPVTVTVEEQTDETSELRYSRAQIFEMSTSSGSIPTSAYDSMGERINVTITGENFGISGEVHIDGEKMGIYAYDHSRIVVPLPEGFGEDIRVEVFVDGWMQPKESLTKPLYFSYDPPEVHAIDRVSDALTNIKDCLTFEKCVKEADGVHDFCFTERRDCFPAKGGVPVQVSGVNFGMTPSAMKFVIGEKECTVKSDYEPLFDHKTFVCSLPSGTGASKETSLELDGRSAASTVRLSYDPPSLARVVPNTPDAEGERLKMHGSNFGPPSSDVIVKVGNKSCENPIVLKDNRIECELQRDVVGEKSVYIDVAGQQVFVPHWMEFLITECKDEWYGLDGELCLKCGDDEPGAECPGASRGPDQVSASKGWYRIDVKAPSPNCHEARQHGETCPVFLPCVPEDVCLGSNECAEGYQSTRCNECKTGSHFRIHGRCDDCPAAPALLGALFAGAIVVAALGGYLINSKQIQMAVFTIGLDYFQVLEMFPRTEGRWPRSMQIMFYMLSIFNINLEIAAPECYIEPQPAFEVKWIFAMAIPMGAFVLLATLYFIQYLYRRHVLRYTRENWHTHIDPIVATGIIIMYVLYLSVSRRSFEAFDCTTTSPHGGTRYLAGNTDIECGESDVHTGLLLPLGIVGTVLYVAAFPLLSFILLRKNRDTVMFDQTLRAHGLGMTPFENRYFRFRRKFQRLYYLFKPEKWYWITLILSRKLFIALVTLLFRNWPTFQLSTALLILFASFVLHVTHWPYMSKVEYADVVESHNKKLGRKEPLHVRIQKQIDENYRSPVRQTPKPASMDVQKEHVEFARSGIPVSEPVVRALSDYNIVESVLLISAIFVNMFGVMFLSDRFDDGKNSGEYDTLGALCLVIVILSALYFILVFVFELLSTFRPMTALWIAHWISRSSNLEKAKNLYELGKTNKKYNRRTTFAPYDTQLNPIRIPESKSSQLSEADRYSVTRSSPRTRADRIRTLKRQIHDALSFGELPVDEESKTQPGRAARVRARTKSSRALVQDPATVSSSGQSRAEKVRVERFKSLKRFSKSAMDFLGAAKLGKSSRAEKVRASRRNVLQEERTSEGAYASEEEPSTPTVVELTKSNYQEEGGLSESSTIQTATPLDKSMIKSNLKSATGTSSKQRRVRIQPTPANDSVSQDDSNETKERSAPDLHATMDTKQPTTGHSTYARTSDSEKKQTNDELTTTPKRGEPQVNFEPTTETNSTAPADIDVSFARGESEGGIDQSKPKRSRVQRVRSHRDVNKDSSESQETIESKPIETDDEQVKNPEKARGITSDKSTPRNRRSKNRVQRVRLASDEEVPATFNPLTRTPANRSRVDRVRSERLAGSSQMEELKPNDEETPQTYNPLAGSSEPPSRPAISRAEKVRAHKEGSASPKDATETAAEETVDDEETRAQTSRESRTQKVRSHKHLPSSGSSAELGSTLESKFDKE